MGLQDVQDVQGAQGLVFTIAKDFHNSFVQKVHEL